MAKKGKAKNTLNKAKHSKLINRKKNKLKSKKEQSALRLKELKRKINIQKENNAQK
jgi:hypothetical protein